MSDNLSKITQSCRFLLNNYPEAQSIKSYLDERLNSQSQELFQFGYFPNTSNIQVLSDLIGEEVLLENELFYYKQVEDSLFPRRLRFCYFENHPLVMPYRDPYGDIVGLVCRTLLPEAKFRQRKISKYKNTKFEKGYCVFGLYENKQHIIDQNSVYVVEGQFDVIKAMEIGFRNIVAIGNNNMTSYQFSVISRYTNNIFLLLDNDEAGQKGRKRALEKFGQLANIRNFYIPASFKDMDEYIAKGKIGEYADLSFVVKD
jgi:DNA primase catalytic core